MAKKKHSYWHRLWLGTDFRRRLEGAKETRASRRLFQYIAHHHVQPGETIVLSCGTTMAFLAGAILDRMTGSDTSVAFGQLTMITTNLEIILEAFSRRGRLGELDLIVPSGQASRKIAGLVPHQDGLVDMPKRAINTIFLSFAGLSPATGFFDESDETWEAKSALLEVLDDRRKVPGPRNVIILMRGERVGRERGSLRYTLAQFQNDTRKGTAGREFLLVTDVPENGDDADVFREKVAELATREAGWGFTKVHDQNGVVVLSTAATPTPSAPVGD